MTTKVTRRPWRVVEFDILAELPDFPNTGIVTAVAGRFSDVDGGSVALDRETLTANLNFIVKACNAYDELVATVEELQQKAKEK